MKLVVIIVAEKDADTLVDTLVSRDFPATKISGTGGFLKKGNAIILAGVEPEEVRDVVTLVKARCPSHREVITPPALLVGAQAFYEPIEVRAGGAIIFVLNVESFEKT